MEGCFKELCYDKYLNKLVQLQVETTCGGGASKTKILKRSFNSIKENCSSGVQCVYTHEASLTPSLPGLHVLPVVAYTSLCWWRGWARADSSLRYLLGLPLLLLSLASTGILFPFVGKYVETGMEIVIRCVLGR